MKTMSKKTWILITCLVLSLAMGLGGSLAYLTDRDADVNVFTMGNVDIELTEDFEQGSELTPGVKVEKDVKVANIGPNTAWVWVEIAIPTELDTPTDASANVVHFNYEKTSVETGKWNWWTDEAKKVWNVKEKVAIDDSGINYNVYTVLYETALKAGETTDASAMFQVYMDTRVDIDPKGDLYVVENGEAKAIAWNIYDQGAPLMHVSAYAIQEQGFGTVQEGYAAYNKQWGENGKIWGSTAEEPAEFTEGESTLNSTIVLDNNTDATDVVTATGAETVVNITNGFYKVEKFDECEDSCVVWAKGGSTVNIYGGEFVHYGYEKPATAGDHIDMIYAGASDGTTGTINIYGGKFWAETDGVWLLNEKDGLGTITVYGGSFKNWNPAGNVSEAPVPNNFVAAGYEVVEEVDAETNDVWYTVVKSK